MCVICYKQKNPYFLAWFQWHFRKNIPTWKESDGIIGCSHCYFIGHISSLSHLFLNIIELRCRECKNLKSLRQLPNTLKLLDIYGCGKIKTLPSLPKTLEKLDISSTSIKFLNILPPSLKVLMCNDTKIEKFPELPATLETLHCDRCFVIYFPELPKGLKQLYCSKTFIIQIPETTAEVHCYFCPWIKPFRYNYFDNKTFVERILKLVKLQKFIKRFLKRRKLRLFSILKQYLARDLCGLILENSF